jgi:hypothetical protein
VVVLEESSDREAVYVDDVLIREGDGIRAEDIVIAVGGSHVPFTLEHRVCEDIDCESWPDNLLDLEIEFDI